MQISSLSFISQKTWHHNCFTQCELFVTRCSGMLSLSPGFGTDTFSSVIWHTLNGAGSHPRFECSCTLQEAAYTST